jgi:hypothetical protein
MSARHRAAVGVLVLGCGLALAAEDDIPDAEFLEYLGSWEESDEEWLIFENEQTADAAGADERSDAAPEGEASTETEDET